MGNEPRHILTIDVEDWYLAHLEFFPDAPALPDDRPHESIITAVRTTLDLLKETGNSATFFVQGTVALHYPELVGEIAGGGHEIASHGYLHRRLIHLSPAEFQSDLRQSLDALAQAGAPPIKGCRVPCFSITRKTLWALEVIKKCGFVYDSSIFPVRRRLYGIPDWPRTPFRCANGLWEFPPATINMFGCNLPVAGGGYLRMLPYPLIAAGIGHRSCASPAVFYFHPYELHPAAIALRHRPRNMQTRLVATLEMLGRTGNPAKIRRLLRDFRFERLDRYLP